jgi:hypothetical protein
MEHLGVRLSIQCDTRFWARVLPRLARTVDAFAESDALTALLSSELKRIDPELVFEIGRGSDNTTELTISADGGLFRPLRL